MVEFGFETIIIGLFNAVLTGGGVCVGTWLGQRTIIKQLEKVETKIIKNKKGKGFI